MTKKTVPFLFLIFLLLAGCNAAINMNGKIASINSGKFLYQDGNLVSNYQANIDRVWNACEKSVADLKATDVQKERKISTGMIKAVIEDEKVIIKVEYIDRDLTSVSVFVGTVGNNMASRLIHDKIIGYLAKN
ncbi:MAG: hypothetical protein CVU72_06765 [Deltaproteobacteria bacterium HGW-Deltaproteobacteria-7]|jgi:hypothetical protein|nr:MAG: hypothetical protein CVU72_06765 [Deltaproteobacteria bacterium HGW-Deltaproteobacteria-7]PKN51057.1 MAG: hypothetical protein CVU55_13035 [Deltaproteobacteria bacterium HGW-Deltaproteobacteria-13]